MGLQTAGLSKGYGVCSCSDHSRAICFPVASVDSAQQRGVGLENDVDSQASAKYHMFVGSGLTRRKRCFLVRCRTPSKNRSLAV